MKKNKLFYIIVITALVVLLIWRFSVLEINKIYGTSSTPISFANSFVAINTLFSGLAFAGLLITIWVQRNQFRDQNFESSFFNLLAHLQTIIEQIKGPVPPRSEYTFEPEGQGREYFYYQIRELNNILNRKEQLALANFSSRYHEIAFTFSLKDGLTTSEPFNLKLFGEFIEEAYDEFYDGRYSYLGHYFRFVFNLLKFVDSSSLNNANKKKYVNLIQAQMTSDELGLILYNGLGKYGREKLYPLLENYKFLENIDERVLAHPHEIARLYPDTKFRFLEF